MRVSLEYALGTGRGSLGILPSSPAIISVCSLYIQNPFPKLLPLQKVDFEWDYLNENHIIDKHDVYTEEAEEAILDRYSVSYPAHSGYRGRIGMTMYGRLLFVVFQKKTPSLIRVITARDPSNTEAKSYRRRR